MAEEILAAAAMPMATASPWLNSSYRAMVSRAWPTVWPKFRIARSPSSRSSFSTTRALMRQHAVTAGSSAAGLWPRSSPAFLSRVAKRLRSAITAHLTTSASPERSSRRGSVLRVAESMSTALGW